MVGDEHLRDENVRKSKTAISVKVRRDCNLVVVFCGDGL